jgi:hypothetical protein
VFRFQPASYRIGQCISAAAMIVLATGVLLAWFGRGKVL